ncbi:thioredoxin-like protein [Kockiozyma suomiensis]|uniref:thioredoxin-like protein n=1 Tax=Kockiozyma suomiensis TaxID=1337062 RepID=UPI00334331AD
MFSSFNSARTVLTLFHSPTSSASRRVLQFLKSQEAAKKRLFELDVTEGVPTKDQLKTILKYAGEHKVSAIVPGAQSYTEASSILEGGSNELLRPMVIDWTNGKAVLGDDEAGVKKLVSSLDL